MSAEEDLADEDRARLRKSLLRRGIAAAPSSPNSAARACAGFSPRDGEGGEGGKEGEGGARKGLGAEEEGKLRRALADAIRVRTRFPRLHFCLPFMPPFIRAAGDDSTCCNPNAVNSDSKFSPFISIFVIPFLSIPSLDG